MAKSAGAAPPPAGIEAAREQGRDAGVAALNFLE
jgi:hypothetical protein